MKGAVWVVVFVAALAVTGVLMAGSGYFGPTQKEEQKEFKDDVVPPPSDQKITVFDRQNTAYTFYWVTQPGVEGGYVMEYGPNGGMWESGPWSSPEDAIQGPPPTYGGEGGIGASYASTWTEYPLNMVKDWLQGLGG